MSNSYYSGWKNEARSRLFGKGQTKAHKKGVYRGITIHVVENVLGK
jgi:hypothetical protein